MEMEMAFMSRRMAYMKAMAPVRGFILFFVGKSVEMYVCEGGKWQCLLSLRILGIVG